MTRQATTETEVRRTNGLTTAVLFENGYGVWGWQCWKCSRPGVLIMQDGFETRDGARRAAQKHEKRRGH